MSELEAALPAGGWTHDLEHTLQTIHEAGYSVEFVDYCESAETPGLLGQIRGVTDHERRKVWISTKANLTAEAITETALHEMRHVFEPAWDCGNRDVLGRGAPLTEHPEIQP